MTMQSVCRPASVPRRSFMVALLIVLVVASFVSTAPARAGNIQPALRQLAIEHPSARARLIVQLDQAANPGESISSLGGTITGELPIINALKVELPLMAVEALGRLDGVRWISLDSLVGQSSTDAVFTTWATAGGTFVPTTFATPEAIIDSGLGPNQTYGGGGRGKGAFGGFAPQITPGHSITRVEVILQAYTNQRLSTGESLSLTVKTATTTHYPIYVSNWYFEQRVGNERAGLVAINITYLRDWNWNDFEQGVEFAIDHYDLRSSSAVYYDAVGLRITSAADTEANSTEPSWSHNSYAPSSAIATHRLRNAYNRALRVTEVWNQSPAYLQGQDVTVAVVDSGIMRNRDLARRVIGSVNFNQGYHNSSDRYGHGTFVAGLIAGDGSDSQGERIGIAPKANLLNVRISDDTGMANESDVVAALQWIYENHQRYNIRVVNLSLNSTVEQSYHTSPMSAAIEILWFNGIVVVASVGNNGQSHPGMLFPPANDPFIITVGAVNDQGSTELADDQVIPFSAYGVTPEGFSKPDLVAPGVNIIGLLPENDRLTISREHPSHRYDQRYFRMSGTSMAAPMVSGAVALLLQDEPHLTPDQVKYRLMATAAGADRWPGYDPLRAGAGYLDIYAAVYGTTTESANTNLPASQLLWSGSDPVNWGSVNWGSVNWGSDYWDD